MMKRKDKKQILDLLGTLKEAGKILASIPLNTSDRELEEVLSQMQTAAISIGGRIEEVEGEGTKAVKLLEEYCEMLWQIMQETVWEKRAQKIKQLPELIALVRESVIEIHEIFDVVFLPYKASMWDCMETVWKAAKDDPDCDVYVIPIPYYDLNPDGTKGEIHYEAELMPEYVTVTSFQKYNLEQEHPDIIYIHNPYDEYNKVTSIHPNFYSSTIKKYTNKLVYIPYFITSGKIPETHSYLPAYVYADKIILQNENMIEDIDETIPREKFLPIGSPKTERLIWMEINKSQVKFPDEWEKSAKGRKVILYNISISGLLKDREKILDKMEEVFLQVSLRNDILLLFRPHPLLEATLDSMCKELTGRYKKLVRYFKKHNIGILDKTPDPDKAVVFSDAYIGEISSSLVDMFGVINKPRLLLSKKKFYQLTKDELKSERTYDVCSDGDDIWFVTNNYQLLCRLNIKDEKIKVVAEAPEIPLGENCRYISVIRYENKIILTPYRADALCIFNIATECFEKQYFKKEYTDIRFGRAFLWKNFLFLIPMSYSAIVRYDIKECKFEYYYQCVRDVLEHTGKGQQDSPDFWAACNYGNEIYIGTKNANVMLQFNMDTCCYSICKVGKESNSYRGIAVDENYCWLILNNSPNVVRWNRRTGEVTEFSNFPKGFKAGAIPFRDIVDFKNELYLVPVYASHICKLDKTTGEISFADFQLPYVEGTYASEFYKRKKEKYDFAKKISDKEMMVLSLYDDSLLILDVEKKSCRKIPVRIEELLVWAERKRSRNLREINEGLNWPISKYLEYVAENLFNQSKRRGTLEPTLEDNLQTGSKIHSEIKKIVLSERQSVNCSEKADI